MATMVKYSNDFAADREDPTLRFIKKAIEYGLQITFRQGYGNEYPEFEITGPKVKVIRFAKKVYGDDYPEDFIE